MGTSKSYGGPKDRTPLLPSWALEPVDVGSPTADPAQGPGDKTENPQPDKSENDAPTSQPNPSSTPRVAPGGHWRAARRSFRNAISSGGDRSVYRNAGREYTRARGGASNAARASAGGRAATAALGAFFSDVARRGFEAAARNFGFVALVGRTADEAVAAVANALAPTGASLEEAAARRATTQVLEKLYKRYGEAATIDSFEQLTSDDVKTVVVESVALYVYNRWLEDLGARIEELQVTPEQAVRLERDVRDYVLESVKLELKEVDPLAVDWKGEAGQAVVERLYVEAYGLLGGPSV